MIDINLKKFKWSHIKIQEIEFWCVGYVYYENVLYSQENLASLFTQFIKKPDFNQFLNRLNGNFAIVAKSDKNIFLLSDIVRSYPLLYKIEDDNIYVFDDDLDFQNKYGNFEIDQDNLREYVCAGLVFGDKTVYKTVYGIQAAEKVVIDISTLKINAERYYMFKYSKIIDKEIDIPQLAKELEVVLIKIFQRVIDSAPNVNNWIIPLSGGHDSRLIAYYFHKLGVKNVICYSYGRKGSIQAKISKKVADALGYDWKFVEIDDKLVKNLHTENLINKYIDYSFGGVSTIGMQNFITLRALQLDGVIKKGDVFVPGHTLDTITGGKINKSNLHIEENKELIKVIKNRYNFWKKGHNFNDTSIDKFLNNFKESGLNKIETFGWQERQAKYIVNTVRGYEMFETDWRLPFWDKEIVDFFGNIPASFQIKRDFFFKAEKLIYDDKLNKIPFDEEYQLNFFENISKYNNYLKRKFFKIFGVNIPYLLDEGFNRVFVNDKTIVKEYLINSDDNLNSFFKDDYSKKISSLHINQIIILKVLNMIETKSNNC